MWLLDSKPDQRGVALRIIINDYYCSIFSSLTLWHIWEHTCHFLCISYIPSLENLTNGFNISQPNQKGCFWRGFTLKTFKKRINKNTRLDLFGGAGLPNSSPILTNRLSLSPGVWHQNPSERLFKTFENMALYRGEWQAERKRPDPQPLKSRSLDLYGSHWLSILLAGIFPWCFTVFGGFSKLGVLLLDVRWVGAWQLRLGKKEMAAWSQKPAAQPAGHGSKRKPL